MGAFFLGERAVYRGKDLHSEFADVDWMDLYVYGFTGRHLPAAQLQLLHTMWVYTSYPDPRLWNNRVASLAGTARSTGALGLSAALAVSEATVYGRRPDIRAIDFFLRTRKQVENGADLMTVLREELERYRGIPGYGRPMVTGDERIPRLMQRATRLGIEPGPFVKLAFDVDRRLMAGRWRLRMNYAAVTAAFCADFGFTAREFYLFAFPAFLAGMIPCLIEAQEKNEGTFLPLPCTRIAYNGCARRSWE